MSDQQDRLDEVIKQIGYGCSGEPPVLDDNQAKAEILAWHKEEARKRETELLDALYWMYMQYCSGGHYFMGGGEDASELLENAGYITVNGGGEIIKDNGDSLDQQVASLEAEDE